MTGETPVLPPKRLFRDFIPRNDTGFTEDLLPMREVKNPNLKYPSHS